MLILGKKEHVSVIFGDLNIFMALKLRLGELNLLFKGKSKILVANFLEIPTLNNLECNFQLNILNSKT